MHTLDVEGVIDRSMEAMVQLTRAERGFLFLIEDDGIQFKVARGAEGKAIEEPTLEVSWSIVRKVVDERRAVRVDDALERPPSLLERQRRRPEPALGHVHPDPLRRSV